MIAQPTHHTLKYGKTAIDYQLFYKERETLAIHVHPNTQVTVEAPLGSNFDQIAQKVRKRAAWIVKQQRNFERYSFELPPRQYVSGETHRYLGRQYQLKVLSTTEKGTVRIDRGRITVYVADTKDQENVEKLLTKWYREQAKSVFKEQLEQWLPRFERFGISDYRIIIRRMRSRWGSCTKKGKVTLNLKLIHVPKQFIDYVIVHELCHLIEHNHSQAFYKLMTRIMPDWEERREKLNAFEF